MPGSPEEFCHPGSVVHIAVGAKNFAGIISSYYGTYIIVETDAPVRSYVKMGNRVKVTIGSGEDQLVFDSRVCFIAKGEQVCLELPASLGRVERRKHLRITAELPICYRSGDVEVISKTINISAGGVYFFTPERLNVGQRIIINLYFTDRILTLKAMVIRTMQNAATVEYCDTNACHDQLVEYIFSQLT
ncbi:PilZ domain-containing protein [Desulforamulus aquiferis]|uniref:PilZ domain-containing protein n=1 Tax=Desulforamulus aquiferis TaxID=1397668 RepID=A0AAW7ZBE8_9FIRM|nr:PilZ domain-containing protein [Desulforamulus aquiferis]MDO7786411.1 PilZ domain-containing protein [Desulforamulus aquiferis]RYD02506.1 hypothetical protein N752_24565 [Desulforamulus aquiferis]